MDGLNDKMRERRAENVIFRKTKRRDSKLKPMGRLLPGEEGKRCVELHCRIAKSEKASDPAVPGPPKSATSAKVNHSRASATSESKVVHLRTQKRKSRVCIHDNPARSLGIRFRFSPYSQELGEDTLGHL